MTGALNLSNSSYWCRLPCLLCMERGDWKRATALHAYYLIMFTSDTQLIIAYLEPSDKVLKIFLLVMILATYGVTIQRLENKWWHIQRIKSCFGLRQGFTMLAPLIFCARQFFVVGGSPMHCSMFPSIPGFYLLDFLYHLLPSHNIHERLRTLPNVPWGGQITPGWESLG